MKKRWALAGLLVLACGLAGCASTDNYPDLANIEPLRETVLSPLEQLATIQEMKNTRAEQAAEAAEAEATLENAVVE